MNCNNGSRGAHASNRSAGTYRVPLASSWPRIRNVFISRRVGPSPRRARAAASRTAATTAVTSFPSTTRPGIPYPAAASARSSTGSASSTGVESPYPLFSTTKRTGSRHAPARLSASWTSPSRVAPSPTKAAATASVPCSWAARARPSATGSMAPRCEIMPTSRFSGRPKWKVRSRPFVYPPARPMSWQNSVRSGSPRVVHTPRLRCIGRIQSRASRPHATPTAIASWP